MTTVPVRIKYPTPGIGVTTPGDIHIEPYVRTTVRVRFIHARAGCVTIIVSGITHAAFSHGAVHSVITRIVEAPREGQTKLLYQGNHIRRFIGMVGIMTQKDMGIDRGIPLPGSDPERRSRIKQQINLLKSYLLLYRVNEWRTLFPHAESPKEWAETVPVVLLSIP